MRLSEIGNKDIIDLTKGCNHGQLWDCELLLERRSGRIIAILIPSGTLKKNKKRCAGEWIQLPWSNIVKTSKDMIIFKSQDLC